LTKPARTAIVLTISDGCYSGHRTDLSGPALQTLLTSNHFTIVRTQTLPDEVEAIATALQQAATEASLIVTTGGTGLSARDVTPEATRQVCDRLIDGLSETIRREGALQTPLAALSRGLCGTIPTQRNPALVINLPGSPIGATTSLSAILGILPHALDLLAGDTEHPQNVS